MAYSGSTAASSVANPPVQLVAPVALSPAITGSTNFLTTAGSTYANNANAPGGGPSVWGYRSTNATTDLTAAGFFSDGFYLGMRAGDVVIGTQITSQGSSVTVFIGALASVSTAGASLSTGSLITSTFT